MSLEIALAKIRKEKEEQTGFLDIGNLGLEEIPDELFDLKHLRGLILSRTLNFGDFVYVVQFDDQLEPLSQADEKAELAKPNRFQADDPRLSNLTSLDKLILFGANFSDLSPLKNLQSLSKLDCSRTQVQDLSPLKNLQSLSQLTCSGTQVQDLSPLKDLQSLSQLNCSRTQVQDLSPLKDLQSLSQLDCYGTQVQDISPLKDLQSLSQLDCSGTQVQDLSPLKDLQSLSQLTCSRTQVQDLSPLKNLQSLSQLDCYGTQVQDLSPLKDLQSLSQLDCSYTSVQDLSPLKDLKKLSSLSAFNCPVQVFPHENSLSNLSELYLGGNKYTLPKIPPEALSQNSGDDCSLRLRSHFADLGDNPVQFDHVKLFILGNGRIGKTQIARTLRDLAYNSSLPSTHGIEIHSSPFELREGKEAHLNIWDFGGQDIYHGTHALFLKSRAIFIIVWTPESETGITTDPDGTTFKNEPLSYWVDYVQRLGGAQSPVLLLQNQCDNDLPPLALQDLRLSPESRKFIEDRKVPVLGMSAKEGRNSCHWKEFEQSLKDSINLLWDVCHPEIGRTRLQLWEEIEKLVEEGKTKKLPWNDYLAQAEEQKITGPEGFAEILHNAGLVFWKESLFEQSLILDQSWCLEAIYSVLTRQKVLQKVQAQNGIFTRKDLDSWVWGEEGHTTEEQEQFLQMMVHCGICFSIDQHQTEPAYIAPELLRLRKDNLAAKAWDNIPETSEEIQFDYPFLPPGTARTILSKLGSYARHNATYWKSGLFFWGTCGTAVMVEEELESSKNKESSSTRAGSITLRTKGDPTSPLRNHLATLIQEELQKQSPSPQKTTETSPWTKLEFKDDSERSFEALPPRSELEWTSKRVLNAMRPGRWKNLYVLGSLDRRITFYSQQVRALRLVRALKEEDRDFSEKSVAVIGGGVAGITAAVAAAKAGCQKVTVYEENHQILQLQARGGHRYIHPHIYQWPQTGSGTNDAGLPLMNWSAENADKVVMQLHQKLKDFENENPSLLEIQKGISIESFRERRNQIELYRKDCFCSDKFDIVILASGFGLENEKPLGADCPSYWRPDNLEGPFSSKNHERILVSGTGDGGLIDLVRATIHTGDGTTYGPHFFQHSKAVELLSHDAQFQRLGELLEEADKHYPVSDQKKDINYDLRRHYHQIFQGFEGKEEIIESVRKLKREDTEVWFNYQTVEDVFNLNSALLNRVLVLLLIESNLIQPLRGRIEDCVEEQDLFAVRMKGKNAFESQRFNRVIMRYGPHPNYLAKRFPELSKFAEELRRKAFLFPVTKLDRTTKAFFESPHPRPLP